MIPSYNEIVFFEREIEQQGAFYLFCNFSADMFAQKSARSSASRWLRYYAGGLLDDLMTEDVLKTN